MSDTRSMSRTEDAASKPRRFVFVLLDNFTLLSFAAAVESLRIANRMPVKPLDQWKIIGEAGDMAKCSAGSNFMLDGDLDGFMAATLALDGSGKSRSEAQGED